MFHYLPSSINFNEHFVKFPNVFEKPKNNCRGKSIYDFHDTLTIDMKWYNKSILSVLDWNHRFPVGKLLTKTIKNIIKNIAALSTDDCHGDFVLSFFDRTMTFGYLLTRFRR